MPESVSQDPQTQAQIRTVKDEINLALDHIESAGLELAEFTPAGEDSLTQRLSDIMYDLEAWKAEAWAALDA